MCSNGANQNVINCEIQTKNYRIIFKFVQFNEINLRKIKNKQIILPHHSSDDKRRRIRPNFIDYSRCKSAMCTTITCMALPPLHQSTKSSNNYSKTPLISHLYRQIPSAYASRFPICITQQLRLSISTASVHLSPPPGPVSSTTRTLQPYLTVHNIQSIPTIYVPHCFHCPTPHFRTLLRNPSSATITMKRARSPLPRFPSLYNVEPLDLSALADELELSVTLRNSVETAVDQWDETPTSTRLSTTNVELRTPSETPDTIKPSASYNTESTSEHNGALVTKSQSASARIVRESRPVKLWDSIKRLWDAIMPNDNRQRSVMQPDASTQRLRTSLLSEHAADTPQKLKNLHMGPTLSSTPEQPNAELAQPDDASMHLQHAFLVEQVTPDPNQPVHLEPQPNQPQPREPQQNPAQCPTETQSSSPLREPQQPPCQTQPLPTVPPLTLPEQMHRPLVPNLSPISSFTPSSAPPARQTPIDDSLMIDTLAVRVEECFVTDSFEDDMDESDLHPDAFPTEEAWSALQRKITPRQIKTPAKLTSTPASEPQPSVARKLSFGSPPVSPQPVRRGPFLSPPTTPASLTRRLPLSRSSSSQWGRARTTQKRSPQPWNLKSPWTHSTNSPQPARNPPSPWRRPELQRSNEARPAQRPWSSAIHSMASAGAGGAIAQRRQIAGDPATVRRLALLETGREPTKRTPSQGVSSAPAKLIRDTDRMMAQRRRITGDLAIDRRLAHLEAIRYQLRERRRLAGQPTKAAVEDLKTLASLREERRHKLIQQQRRLSMSMRVQRVGNVPRNVKLSMPAKRKRVMGRGGVDSPTGVYEGPHVHSGA